MKTICINVYEYDELTPEAQQKVVEKYWDLNVLHDWWDITYDDAANVGLKITGCDLDRNRSINIEFINSPFDTAERIIKEHGEQCDTFKCAAEYLARRNGADEDGLDSIDLDFKSEIEDCYWRILRDESEYLTSRETIIDTIKSNEYTFTIEGVMKNS